MLVTISFKSLTYYEVTLQCEWSSKYENFNGVFLEIMFLFYFILFFYFIEFIKDKKDCSMFTMMNIKFLVKNTSKSRRRSKRELEIKKEVQLEKPHAWDQSNKVRSSKDFNWSISFITSSNVQIFAPSTQTTSPMPTPSSKHSRNVYQTNRVNQKEGMLLCLATPIECQKL